MKNDSKDFSVVDEFEHPMGKLVLSSNPENEFYCIISFVPNQIIDPIKVEAIRWFFEDGDGRFTGWETSFKTED